MLIALSPLPNQTTTRLQINIMYQIQMRAEQSHDQQLLLLCLPVNLIFKVIIHNMKQHRS